MNPQSGLLAAAVTGMLLGVTGCASKSDAPSSESPAAHTAAASGGEAHHCKGQNACKGQGECKTDQHACKGQNECKGQGGCKTS